MDRIPDDQSCPHCGRYKNRGISVDAIIVNGNKILLGKRKHEPFKDFWGTFGGFVEWSETVEDALIRETKEECGLDVVGWKLLGVYSDPARDPRGSITIAYLIETSGTPRAGDDISEVEWFSFDNLPELPFDHSTLISDYLKTAN